LFLKLSRRTHANVRIRLVGIPIVHVQPIRVEFDIHGVAVRRALLCSLPSKPSRIYNCISSVIFWQHLLIRTCTRKEQVVSLFLLWPHFLLDVPTRILGPTKRKRNLTPSKITYHKYQKMSIKSSLAC